MDRGLPRSIDVVQIHGPRASSNYLSLNKLKFQGKVLDLHITELQIVDEVWLIKVINVHRETLLFEMSQFCNHEFILIVFINNLICQILGTQPWQLEHKRKEDFILGMRIKRLQL
ncbi:hypothetical protein ACS0TY_031805 [Phlomoides rotata]